MNGSHVNEGDGSFLDDRKAIAGVDPQGMTGLVESLPEQWVEAISIARGAELGTLRRPQQVLILGMGGSAIGGDLARALLEAHAPVPIAVHRGYVPPAYVGPGTLAIASSYSGNTEETLEAAERAREAGAQMVAITTGGELERRAKEHGWPIIKIPGGLSPRAAIAYSLVPLLVLLERAGVTKDVSEDLAEAAEVLKSLRTALGPDNPVATNPAKQLALSLRNRLPLIYGSQGWKGVAAYRWKCQINENAKAPAVWNVFPELNHNETVGWEAAPEVTRMISVIVLRDRADDRRTQARVEVTREIMEGAVADVTEVWAQGRSELARLVSLIYPGDWVSLYLALANRIDPTPIRMIDLLKSRLASL